MIDIIIPAYNSHDTIINTLMSISIQINRDMLNVYICNDKSDRDYSDIIKRFDGILNIKELDLEENSGPGVARQLGLDNSNSEFVVFIDSDDVFYTPISLRALYDAIEQNNADIVIANFKEETNDGFYDHNGDVTWLHGKIYRRSFLKKHNIRFNKSRNNEDNFFNKSIFMRKPNIYYIEDIVYLWINNQESITRRNNHEYDYSGFFDLIDNLTEVTENAISDNISREIICEYIFSFLTSVYFFYLQYLFREDCYKIIDKSRRIKELYEQYKFENKEDENKVYLEQLRYYIDNLNNSEIIRPKITFEEFLKLYD